MKVTIPKPNDMKEATLKNNQTYTTNKQPCGVQTKTQ